MEMLLERSSELEQLGRRLAAVRETGRGHVLLVAGEAGVGKTSLLRAFETSAGVRSLWGACDPLFAPRPLGPFVELSRTASTELRAAVEGEAMAWEVVTALEADLRRDAPAIVVIDDLHWADEATLDVLRLLARRPEQVPALVLATYRDDELSLGHPLRLVLGELATNRDVSRLAVPRLSPEAVAELAAPHAVDADELYRRTEGNPFFVVEALDACNDGIPETIRDAV
ncbi:MAG: AAA family ATPase, partial [Actinomycetota bacterium]